MVGGFRRWTAPASALAAILLGSLTGMFEKDVSLCLRRSPGPAPLVGATANSETSGFSFWTREMEKSWER